MISPKKILIMCSMMACMQLVAEDKSYLSKEELRNPIAWFMINSYDTAVLYSVFYKLHEDPNDKTAKIATLKQELIDSGIPFTTLAYSKMAHSKQVNEVLAFFNDADKPTRSLIACFIDWRYNKERVYRMFGGIAGVLCLTAIINKCLT